MKSLYFPIQNNVNSERETMEEVDTYFGHVASRPAIAAESRLLSGWSQQRGNSRMTAPKLWTKINRLLSYIIYLFFNYYESLTHAVAVGMDLQVRRILDTLREEGSPQSHGGVALATGSHGWEGAGCLRGCCYPGLERTQQLGLRSLNLACNL